MKLTEKGRQRANLLLPVNEQLAIIEERGTPPTEEERYSLVLKSIEELEEGGDQLCDCP